MSKVKITVPASSANLGPGFDTLGLCLSLYNVFTFEERAHGFSFSGVEYPFCNENNLAAVSFRRTLEYLGLSDIGFHLTIDENNIPISRGLGSSSSFILAGILAANAFTGNLLNRDAILKIAAGIEGHPDNVCASLFGGITMAMKGNDRVYYSRVLPDSSLHFTVFVPGCQLLTEKSRAILPETYSREDCSYNIQHSLLLIQGLQMGDTEMIGAAIKDKIHVPYRKPLIPEYDLIEEIAKEAGAIAVTISGAGPTILAISKKELKREDLESEIRGKSWIDWEVKNLAVDTVGCVVQNV